VDDRVSRGAASLSCQVNCQLELELYVEILVNIFVVMVISQILKTEPDDSSRLWTVRLWALENVKGPSSKHDTANLSYTMHQFLFKLVVAARDLLTELIGRPDAPMSRQRQRAYVYEALLQAQPEHRAEARCGPGSPRPDSRLIRCWAET
jgi:hypothetical protein